MIGTVGSTGHQTELKDVAADATEGARWLQTRTFDQQDRARRGSLLLFVGAIAVVLGLLLMWATRPEVATRPLSGNRLTHRCATGTLHIIRNTTVA